MESPSSMKEGVGKFTSSIVRGRRRGDLENLLATELALATNSVDPILKIRHIIEAYMLLSLEEKGKILPDEEDRARLERAYSLSLALLSLTPTHDSVQFDRSMIPFPFAPDKAHEYLDFLSITWDLSGYFKTKGTGKDYYKQLAIYLSSGDASSGMCLQVKNLFVRHELPWILILLRLIFTSFISAEAWKEASTSFSTKSGMNSK